MLRRFDKLEWLDASQLDVDDRTYAITPCWFPVDQLAASMKQAGIINPLHVESVAGGGYRIVCGFRRARAAADAGLVRLPCWIRKNCTRSSLFVESVLDNAASRPLHELEKATAIAKLLREFRMSPEKVQELFLPLLGIRPTAFQLKRYLEIDSLPENLRRAMDQVRLDLEPALVARHWTENEQQALVGLLSRYRLNVNTQKKLVELLDELRRITRKSTAEIWAQAVAGSEPGPTPGAEFERALGSLFRLRMPALSALEQQYRELKAALRLPAEIRLQPPAYFEGDRLTVSFSAGNASEFRDAAERLRLAAETSEMEGIFRLL